jgi:hypothetical protein
LEKQIGDLMKLGTFPQMTVAVIVPALVVAFAITTIPAAEARQAWSPVASERLMKLPADSLNRAIENDFARSSLASRLGDVDEQIAFKQMTLQDLKDAAGRAEEADLRANLQYELLQEKRNYLQLVKEQQSLRKQHAQTKLRLFEKVLAKQNRVKRAKTPAQKIFIANQKQARVRMERTVASVDTALLASTAVETSKYSSEYRKNLSAIQELTDAIKNHPMNRAPAIAGQQVTKEEYLRQLIAQAQGELAIVEQENLVLGHMAKLVSLDALALAEGIREEEADAMQTVDGSDAKSPADLVDVFTNQD